MLYDKIKKHTVNREVSPDDTHSQGVFPESVYPFHMPGHKRNPAFCPVHADGTAVFPNDIDITEICDFDDLHDMHGVLLEISMLAADLYAGRKSFLLVNGSTSGNLAAIGACTKRGDKILTDKNCHRSVKNAAFLFGLTPVFIAPQINDKTGVPAGISPDSVKTALDTNRDVSLAVITSPSYEGVVSDIEAISCIVHNAGALLLVDCAHGAHFGFSDKFPENPAILGADITVVSLHKTLPALTQCSLLHVCSDRVDVTAVNHMLGILQTSSPSYVLMSSTDYCLRLLSAGSERLFSDYVNNLEYFFKRTSGLKRLIITCKEHGFYDFDPGKIVISVRNTSQSGYELMEILRGKYNLELERASDDYVIAMTSICDTREGFTRLADALTEIDSS